MSFCTFGKIKSFKLFSCLVLVLISLAGCSNEKADISNKSNVVLFEDAHIEADIVEDFAQTYYNENELMNMVNEEITTYNLKKGGEPISVISESLVNNVVSLNLSFKTLESYNDYMPEQIFIGTIQEAFQSGYDFNRSLWIVGKDDATIGKNDLMNMASSKVVIIDGDVTLRLPNKILYYSQGMTLVDDYTVETEKEDVYFVIYK